MIKIDELLNKLQRIEERYGKNVKVTIVEDPEKTNCWMMGVKLQAENARNEIIESKIADDVIKF